jgi:AraC-like DNA-binding protein
VYLREAGFVNSFTSGHQAIECATAIQKKLAGAASLIDLRIAVHAGDPVNQKDNSIFGATIGFAQFLCNIGKTNEIIMSSVVHNLFEGNDLRRTVGLDNIRYLTAANDFFLETLFDTLSSHWHNSDFDVPDFCRAMSLSKAQLYRKCVALTDMSPNMLLREYRLLRSLEFLRAEERNISQTTFDTGFSSPSYFTKCFQKRFGIQPLVYLKSRS